MTSRLRKIIGNEEEQRRSMHINRPQSYDTTTQPMREGFAQGRSDNASGSSKTITRK